MFTINITIGIDPSLQNAAKKLAASKAGVDTPVGKKKLGPWDSVKPTPDKFSVNEDPYPKPTDGEVSPRGLKEKFKRGYYGYGSTS